MMWWGDGWPSWTAVPMVLVMLLFWGLLAWAVVALLRPAGRGAPPGDGAAAPTAEQRLARRLAEGDIDVAEYEERLAALRRARRAGPPAV